MVVFGIKTEPNDLKLAGYMFETKIRFREKNLVKNPFKADFKKIKDGFYLFNISPIYPPYHRIGWFILIAILILTGFSWWLSLPILFISIEFFWSRYFYFIMFLIGLRIYGYKGRARLILDRTILNEVVEWDR